MRVGAAIAQENEDDDDDEDDGEGEGALDIADGGAGLWWVRSRTMVVSMPWGMMALIEGTSERIRSDRVNDVCAWLAEDDEKNGALAV